MNILEPKILLMYNRELEAYKIEPYLRKQRLQNLRVTNHFMTGVKHGSTSNVDIIISNLQIGRQLVAEKILSKKSLLGIPIIFYTDNREIYDTYKNSKLITDNTHVALILNPTENINLIFLIKKFHKLKLANKTKSYFLAKKHLGLIEKVYFKEITYIESEVCYCKLHTKWGTYKISGTLAKLLLELGSDFIKIHEKYVVNRKHVSDLSSQVVKIQNITLPLGRRFQSEVMKKLRKNKTERKVRLVGQPLLQMMSVG